MPSKSATVSVNPLQKALLGPCCPCRVGCWCQPPCIPAVASSRGSPVSFLKMFSACQVHQCCSWWVRGEPCLFVALLRPHRSKLWSPLLVLFGWWPLWFWVSLWLFWCWFWMGWCFLLCGCSLLLCCMSFCYLICPMSPWRWWHCWSAVATCWWC